MKLWGRNYTQAELHRYFGHMMPAAGIRRFTFDEGRAKGLSAVEVKTGAGLRFVVLLDKALDIGDCDWRGIPILCVPKLARLLLSTMILQVTSGSAALAAGY